MQLQSRQVPHVRRTRIIGRARPAPTTIRRRTGVPTMSPLRHVLHIGVGLRPQCILKPPTSYRIASTSAKTAMRVAHGPSMLEQRLSRLSSTVPKAAPSFLRIARPTTMHQHLPLLLPAIPGSGLTADNGTSLPVMLSSAVPAMLGISS